MGEIREGVKKKKKSSGFSLGNENTSLEKETATHSSILAWRISGMGEPDGLPSMGLQSQIRLT